MIEVEYRITNNESFALSGNIHELPIAAIRSFLFDRRVAYVGSAPFSDDLNVTEFAPQTQVTPTERWTAVMQYDDSVPEYRSGIALYVPSSQPVTFFEFHSDPSVSNTMQAWRDLTIPSGGQATVRFFLVFGSLDEIRSAVYTLEGRTTSAAARFRAANGQYVVAEGGGGGDVNANRDVAGPWETFGLIDRGGAPLVSGDTVNINTNSGNFVRAWDAGGGAVDAGSAIRGTWETYIIQKIGGGGTISSGDLVSLRTRRGYYFVAEEDGGGDVNANRPPPAGAWETFTFIVP